MDADSSSSVTDSDDEPSPTKFKFGKMSSNKTVMIEQSGGAMDENTVIYRIYALPSLGANQSSDVEASINSTNLSTLQAFAYNLSKDYIWHNEPFRLALKGEPISHFFGQTNFGENSEDEWFIVYLLFEISKNFPDYIISILDSDGQFMLIEAADYLPSWLDGDVADNRVFVFRGALHIVPLSKRLKPCPRSLSPSSINQLLIDDPGRIFAILLEEQLISQSLAAENIQRAILDRIKIYPEQISSNRHRINCVLPAKLVALFNDTGSIFLAPAVHAACQKNEKLQSESFSLNFASTDLLTTSIVLSKHLYAKLVSSKETPRYEGSNWMLPKKDAIGFKANDLGMKLTKGVESLASKATGPRGDVNNEELQNKSWQSFVDVLRILGYFETAPEGSKAHDRLLKRAQLFHQVCSGEATGETYVSSLGSRLAATIQHLEVVDIDVLRSECPPKEEDGDEWLTITPEQLETMLSQKWTNNPMVNGSPKVKTTGKTAMANGEHPSLPSVVPKHKAEDSMLKNNPRPTLQGATSDPFTESVKKMLDLHIPHDGDDSSDMESYGDEMLDLSMDEKDAAAAVNAFANNLKQYMGMMEKETKVGTSTKPKQGKNHAKSKSRSKGHKSSTLRESAKSPSGDSIDEEDDVFTPVDIDKRMVSGILESYFPEACGQSSSASSLLHGDRLATKKHHGKKSSN